MREWWPREQLRDSSPLYSSDGWMDGWRAELSLPSAKGRREGDEEEEPCAL